MVNIFSLIGLVVLIYSILGVYMFSEIKLNGALDEHKNFQTLGAAFVTLITVSTGEDYPSLM
jgi:flagellar motor component MotA